MKLTPEIKRKLKNFDFRYAEHIEGTIHSIKTAKEAFPNPKKPHVLNEECMAFWCDDCVDHPYCIKLEDILIF